MMFRTLSRLFSRGEVAERQQRDPKGDSQRPICPSAGCHGSLVPEQQALHIPKAASERPIAETNVIHTAHLLKILFIDVETTGLADNDRVVSFGCVLNDESGAKDGKWKIRYTHLVFDPGKRSHPAAERVHGWDGWTLSHQRSFVEHVDDIQQLIDDADVIVAHNAEFDVEFLNHELLAAGRHKITKPIYCTMTLHREKYPNINASLDSAIAGMGICRSQSKHGALEDAWLCMQLWYWLHAQVLAPSFAVVENNAVRNLQPVPTRTDGVLSRRKRRRDPAVAAPMIDTDQNTEKLVFEVRGSASDPYEVIFTRTGRDVSAECTCPAGMNGRHCKHRLALIFGDVANLVSGNEAEVIRLKNLLQGTDVDAACREYLEAEADCGRAKKRFVAAKKRLVEAFH